jgi:homoserine O-acetyltransferase/O-succinyltransferase
MAHSRVVLVSLLMFLACASGARAQAPVAEGAQQFADLGDFKLQNGSTIRDLRLGYRTLGKLNSDRSNVILWPSWLGGTTQDLLPFIGPNNVVDSGKYFVILVDALGNHVSSSPSNSKRQPLMTFPEFTVRDMVEAQHRLAAEVFHLQHIHAVMGISLGAMQAFAWALVYPDFMDLAIPMLGSPQSTSYDKLLWTTEIEAMESDPAWNHGHPTKPLSQGIALSIEIEEMHNTSPAYRAAHTGTEAFDGYLSDLKKNAKADGGIASDQIRQRQAILNLDLPRDFGVSLPQLAKMVHAKMLIVVCTQDHMVNPAPASEFAAAADIPLIRLNSSCGHRSLTCVSIGPLIANFLENPASAKSDTLQDKANP